MTSAYVNGLLRRDYQFADVLAVPETVHSVPLAAFAQEPPSYRTAALGVVTNPSSAAVDQCRSLGAPQIFQVSDSKGLRWKVPSTGSPELLQQIPASEIAQTIRSHHQEWAPDAVARARGIGFDGVPAQLDFFDVGLLPAIDAVVRQKLDRLLRDAIAGSEAAYQEHQLKDLDYAGLFRLVFRLLAAKLLADRGHPGRWLWDDPRDVLNEVEQFYFGGGKAEPVLSHPSVQMAAWNRIRSGLHLQNISVEALAYVYENTLVDDRVRQLYGTHSTPPEVAEYIVRHLPFHVLPPENRCVFEPFAGHASLLIAALGRLRNLLPVSLSDQDRHAYLVKSLKGMEIDAFAREIGMLSLMLADYPNPNGWDIIAGDAFATPEFSTELEKATTVLCNPPFEDFRPEERQTYRGLQSTNKAADTLLKVLRKPPQLLGFVLPRVFIDGQSYRDARRLVASTYDEVEVLTLPDVAFQHSGVETVLLTAHGRRQMNLVVRAGGVTKQDYRTFARSGRASFQQSAEIDRSTMAAGEPLWVYPLHGVWLALEQFPRLGDVADVHNGIEYNLSFDTHVDELVSERPREGFVAGIARVADGFEPLFLPKHIYLNMQRALMRRGSYQWPWQKPKVVVNSARLSRGHWVLTGVPDDTGLVAYHNFHGVWPTSGLTVEAIAAVLNGPIANAYASSHITSRHNRIETLRAIPIPVLTQQQIATLTTLVERLVNFLAPAEVDALLAAPDRATWTGRRDHALLLVAVQTGLRVSELTALTCADVHLGPGPHVSCRGKGRKERITPLTSGTVSVLRVWLKERAGQLTDRLFPTRRGRRLSRDAVEHRLAAYTSLAAGACPSLRAKRISAHVLRHTAAMQLLHAGVDHLRHCLVAGT